MTTARLMLEEVRSRTTQRLADLRGDYRGFVEASKDSNADDEHDPEGATIAFERSQVGALVRQAEAQLLEVEAALTRIDEGTYGVCDVCAEAIPADRLVARPTATTCVICAASAGVSRRS